MLRRPAARSSNSFRIRSACSHALGLVLSPLPLTVMAVVGYLVMSGVIGERAGALSGTVGSHLRGAALEFGYVLLILAGAFLLLRRRVLEPLRATKATVEQWLQGNLEPVVPRQEGEVGELGRLVNRLIRRFQRDLDEVKSLVERSETGMLVVDAKGTIVFANPAVARLMNRPMSWLLGSELGVPVVAAQRTEIETHRGSNCPGVAELSSSEIKWDGEPAHLVTFHDITDRQRAEEATRHQAFHDDLTGLPNRAHFRDRLDEAIQRAANQNCGLAVLFIDLDRFKEVNDTLGHAAGDELLKALAKRLRHAVRATDLVARMGGDEFTVLLEGVNDRETAVKVAEKLRSAVFMPVDLHSQTVTVGGTIGLSLYPEDGTEAQTLFMQADTAMYHAKDAGRNRVHAFAASEGRAVANRFWMEQALQCALENGEFRLEYQPQVKLPGGEPRGVEALLRWEHPEEGSISPADFIPLLEETDMIHSVGDWIFRQAAFDLENWEKAGLYPDRIWINVAARQLDDHDLVDRLDRLADEAGVRPDRFGIELTESSFVGDIDHSISVLTALRNRGFCIAMDDFGTGYSALSFLRHLPLDEVKVDLSFIQDLGEHTAVLSVVRAIIAMGHALGLSVLGEGVEKASQANTLGAEGCEYAQGFWFARPMPPDQLAEWWTTFTDSHPITADLDPL